MPTPRETDPAAPDARLSALPATALRDDGGVPSRARVRVPTDGALNLGDGAPVEPDLTRSPHRYHNQHPREERSDRAGGRA